MFRTLMQFVACSAVVLSPVLMLSVKGGAGYCFFVVFLLSLIYLSSAEGRRHAALLYRAHRAFVIGMLALPAVILLQIVVLRVSAPSALDPFLRFALAVPCFFLLASLPSRQLRLVQWGFVVGALTVGAWAVYVSLYPEAFQWTYGNRLGNSFTNPIPFGDTAILLAFMSVISISRKQSVRTAEVAIKVLALVLAGYASLRSGSRGGWIAIPLLVWATLSGRHLLNTARSRFVWFGVALACIAAFAVTSTTIRTRFEAVGTDIESMQQGNGNTSVGLRFNLWQACTKLYLEHPVFGVGRGNLDEALGALAERGEAPRDIVNSGGHSEFFSAISQTGTVGLVALLMLYAGTFHAFWRYRRHPDPEVVTAAYMGVGTVGATVIFGLTIDALTLVMSTAFFALTVATLLAWIDARVREQTTNSDCG